MIKSENSSKMLNVDGDNICIVCINVAFANAGALQNALDCHIVIQQTEAKGFDKLLTRTPLGINSIPDVDHYIFAGSGILSRIDVPKLNGRKTVIISDSHYLQNTREIDEIIQMHNIEVFCMADLWKFCKFEKKMYVHPFIPISTPIKKNKVFTICHSPYHKVKTNQKGSKEIEAAVNQLKKGQELEYSCIKDSTWEETLAIKAGAHFFVDQLSLDNHYAYLGYEGGLGKSGLEGMLLKCLTFCGGKPFDSDIPAPPYVVTNRSNDLLEKMTYYIQHRNAAESRIKRQYDWSIKHTNHIEVAKRILE